MLAMQYGAAFDPEEVGFCAVPGGRIWFRLSGKAHFAAGATPILCIHGGPGLSHHYLLTLAALSDTRPVILYDQLDSGNSDMPGDEANWRLPRFLDEISCLRSRLNLSVLDVFGSSWGGTIAAEYAISKPDGLRSVILASPVIDVARWVQDCEAMRSRLDPALRLMLDKHEQEGTVESTEYQDAVLHFYRRHLCRLDLWPWELDRSFELFNYT
ncbi:alpha/beta fold hydrolase, partial [Brucella grignonensis]